MRTKFLQLLLISLLIHGNAFAQTFPSAATKYRIFCGASYRYVNHTDNTSAFLKTIPTWTSGQSNDDQNFMQNSNELFQLNVSSTVAPTDSTHYLNGKFYNITAPIGGYTYYLLARGNNSNTIKTQTALVPDNWASTRDNITNTDWYLVFRGTIDGIDYYSVRSHYKGTVAYQNVYMWLANGWKDPNDFKTSAIPSTDGFITDENDKRSWIGFEPENTTTPQMLKKALALYNATTGGTGAGQYSTAARTALNTAILSTQTVFENSASVEADKNTALTNLYNAIWAYQNTITATNVTATSFSANWGAITGATKYYIDVTTDKNFGSTLSTYIKKNVDAGVGTGTSCVISGLTANTTYYYRVRPYSGTNQGISSSIITVTTAPAASTASAATNVTSTGFTASWSAVTNATSYKLDVATDNAFTNLVSGYNNLDVTGTTKDITGLSGNTTYYYRVRAVNGTTWTTDNSNVITATTAIPTTIVSAKDAKFSVYVKDNMIVVVGANAPVKVFTVSGTAVDITKPVTTNGIYIVKCDNKVEKVVVK